MFSGNRHRSDHLISVLLYPLKEKLRQCAGHCRLSAGEYFVRGVTQFASLHQQSRAEFSRRTSLHLDAPPDQRQPAKIIKEQILFVDIMVSGESLTECPDRSPTARAATEGFASRRRIARTRKRQ